MPKNKVRSNKVSETNNLRNEASRESGFQKSIKDCKEPRHFDPFAVAGWIGYFTSAKINQ